MAKVLIIGSGGREHSIGWKIAQSEHVEEVIYAPGNGGTAMENKGKNISISPSKDNFPALLDLVKSEKIDLTIVGPEDPLANGIVDYFNKNAYIRAFGPSQVASQLEGDKFFSFNIMSELNLPQAAGIPCYSIQEAKSAIKAISTEGGVVLKARGLHAGKGVLVCDSGEEALEKIVGHARDFGEQVLISDRLFGQEFSVFGISDGNTVLPLEISLQDHKPLLDGDKGPNTGGMGAYGPAPIADVAMVRYVAKEIMTPVVRKMRDKGQDYKGFLYAGMIMTKQGPEVIEFNVRFGDPEAQPAMMMMKNDLYEALSLGLDGKLDKVNMEFHPGASCCVVMASDGYPGKYKKGLPIAQNYHVSPQTKVFHAGTKMDNGQLLSSGGRVLGVTSRGDTIEEAQRLAYEGVETIQTATKFLNNNTNIFYSRTDIADKALRQIK